MTDQVRVGKIHELVIPPAEGKRFVTATEYARSVLRTWILNGDLPGGTRLVQSEIASALGVSTTPVREALRGLASEGMLRFDELRGAVVEGIDQADYLEIYELRLLLEPWGIRRAASGFTDAHAAVATDLCDRMEVCVDSAEWASLNRAFHGNILEAFPARLQSFLRMLQDGATRYVAVSLVLEEEQRQKANQEHRELLDALVAGDGEQAAAIVRAHLLSTMAVFDVAKVSWQEEERP